jgi:2'-5' RNA ligase
MNEELFHLWLMPDEKSRRLLKQVTDPLSQKQESIPIEPHVSLLLRILGTEKTLSDQLPALAQTIPPMTIRLDTIEDSDERSRCIYWKATLSEALRAARESAEKRFHSTDARAFMPHTSLRALPTLATTSDTSNPMWIWSGKARSCS